MPKPNLRLRTQQELASHLNNDTDLEGGSIPEERRRLAYGNLFFLLQTDPAIVASLTRQVSMAEIDTLLQTVMFTLFGDQYEAREEHLLLSVFHVRAKEERKGKNSIN